MDEETETNRGERGGQSHRACRGQIGLEPGFTWLWVVSSILADEVKSWVQPMTSDGVSLSSSAPFQHSASVADVGVRCGLLHQHPRLNRAKWIFLVMTDLIHLV